MLLFSRARRGRSLEPAGDEVPLHAASRATAAVAMMTAAVRAGRGHARRGQCVTRVLRFVMPASAGLAAFRFIAALFEMVRRAVAFHSGG